MLVLVFCCFHDSNSVAKLLLLLLCKLSGLHSNGEQIGHMTFVLTPHVMKHGKLMRSHTTKMASFPVPVPDDFLPHWHPIRSHHFVTWHACVYLLPWQLFLEYRKVRYIFWGWQLSFLWTNHPQKITRNRADLFSLLNWPYLARDDFIISTNSSLQSV